MPARPILWRAVLVAACSCMMAGMAASTPTDFSFKPGTDLAHVFETVGVVGKFNVLVLPGAGPLRTTYTARLVEPEETLKLLAAAHGMVARKLPAVPGGSDTWVVGTLRQVRELEPETELVVTVRFSPLEALEPQILAQLGRAHLTVMRDARTRRLFLRGSAEAVAKAVELVRDLDVPLPAATVHLTLVAGAPGKTKELWKGSQALVTGEVTKLKLLAQPGKNAEGWRASAIDGTVSARVSPDDLCTLTAEIEVVVDSPAGPVKTVLAASVQARSGQDVQIASHELGGDRALSLTARVEVAHNPVHDLLEDLDGPSPRPPAPPSPAAPAPSPAGDELDLTTPSVRPSPSPGGTEIDTEL